MLIQIDLLVSTRCWAVPSSCATVFPVGSRLVPADTLTHIAGFHQRPCFGDGGTMVWQMVISPKSGDAMQQRMLYFMPIVFLTFAIKRERPCAVLDNSISLSSTLLTG